MIENEFLEGYAKFARLPSKQSGTGLGLPLCTEILSAHGGGLRIQRRSGGGTVVTCILPSEEDLKS